MSTNITYGSYDFRNQAGPIPLLSINKNMKVDGAGAIIGSVYQLTLQGTLTPLPSGNIGYQNLDYMQDALMSGFNSHGLPLVVTCNGDTLMTVYPRVSQINLATSNDNWVQTTPYTIELQYDGEPITGSTYVDSATESWTVQIDESNSVYDWTYTGTPDKNSVVLNISHEVSAKGVEYYNSGGLVKPAWQQAKDWVVGQLGIAASDINSNNVINLTGSNFSNLNHIRVEQRGERDGTFSVQESWVSLDTSIAGIAGSGIEDFTASIKQDAETNITTIDINGSIRGLEVRNMSGGSGTFAINTTKYASASGCWSNIRPKLMNRAKIVSSSLTSKQLNPQPINLSVGHNPTQGVITYSYTYDDRPCNLIAGAIFENINITDIYPNDVIAVIPILGRGNGPLIQDMGTKTESHRVINLDIVIPSSGCTWTAMNSAKPTGVVNSFLCEVQEELIDAGYSVFVASNQSSWDAKKGRYTHSLDLIYAGCSGGYYTTNFCS